MPPVPSICYVFDYCRRRPKVESEASAYLIQSAKLNEAKARGDIAMLGAVVDLPTNRSAAFFERRKFLQLVRRAEDNGACIAVDDMSRLLGTVHPDKGSLLVKMLQDCPVEIWDAARRSTWNAVPVERREIIIIEAWKGNARRSMPVKLGLRNANRSGSDALKKNAERGRTANRLAADRLAAKLAPLVLEVMNNLPAGASLSPTRLARELNMQGIVSPRGGGWSHNSAKNLMARIAKLKPSAPDPSVG